MTENIKQIALRLKELRSISGNSIKSLSEVLSIPEKAIENYESGVSDIPITFIFAAAQYYKVDITDILTGQSPKLSDFCVVKKDKGISIKRREQYEYQHLAYNFNQKKFEPFLVTVQPCESSIEDFNSHPGQEFNYVLEGKMLVVLNGHEIILEEGDSLIFNSELQHAMKALDNKPAKFLVMIH